MTVFTPALPDKRTVRWTEIYFFGGTDMDENEDKSADEKLGETVAEEVVREIVKPVVDIVEGLAKGFEKGLAKIAGTKELTYEEAMKYLLAHKKDSPDIKKGALCKEDGEKGTYLISAVLLDKDNNPVNDTMGRHIGCQWSAERLDDELRRTFKDKSTVIVQ
jgi:hypothetical protein